ncbi:MAG: DUF748 domain-containing protein, partial [Methylococcales bacterium]
MSTQRIFSKTAKTILICTGVLLTLGTAGVYMLPSLLQTKLVDIIQDSTGRNTSLAKVDLGLFPLRIGLHDFAMQELNGQPFVSFSEFAVQINTTQSISQSALVIDKIALSKPNVKIARLKNGDFNFKDLIKPEDKSQPENSAIFPVNITKLSIAEGKFTWKDDFPNKPEQEDIAPINLEISNFSTQSSTPAGTVLSFALSSGGKFTWQGDLGLKPMASSGHLKLEQLPLQRLKTLALQDILPFDIQGNELIDLDYQFAKTDKDMTLNIKQSNIELHDFQLSQPGTNNLQVKIPSLALTGAYQLSFAKSMKLAVKQSKLAIRDVQYSAQEPDNMQINIPAIDLEGDYDLSQDPQQLELSVNNSKLSLKELLFAGNQPGPIQVKAPALSLEGQYTVNKAGEQLDVTVNQGKFALQNIQLSEPGQNTALVKIPDFNLQGIDFNLIKQQLTIAAVNAGNAEVKSWLDKQGQLNYQTLFAPKPNKPEAAGKAAETPAAANAKLWNIQVNTIDLANFGLSFEDRSLKKPVTMTAKPINVKLSNYSNKTGAKLPFQVNVGINQNGSIKLNGDAVISPLAANVAVAVKAIDLEKFQPYVDKFARLDIIDGSFNV